MQEIDLIIFLRLLVGRKVRLADGIGDNSCDGELVELIVNAETRFGVRVNDTLTALFRIGKNTSLVIDASGFVQINL